MGLGQLVATTALCLCLFTILRLLYTIGGGTHSFSIPGESMLRAKINFGKFKPRHDDHSVPERIPRLYDDSDGSEHRDAVLKGNPPIHDDPDGSKHRDAVLEDVSRLNDDSDGSEKRDAVLKGKPRLNDDPDGSEHRDAVLEDVSRLDDDSDGSKKRDAVSEEVSRLDDDSHGPEHRDAVLEGIPRLNGDPHGSENRDAVLKDVSRLNDDSDGLEHSDAVSEATPRLNDDPDGSEHRDAVSEVTSRLNDYPDGLENRDDMEKNSHASYGGIPKNRADDATGPPVAEFIDDPSLQIYESEHRLAAMTPAEAWLVVKRGTKSKKKFVVARCLYEQQQREYDPLGHAEFFAYWFGSQIFPEYEFELRDCVSIPEYLPKGVLPSSSEGLKLLGLSSDIDFRLCNFGASQIIKTLLEVPGVTMGKSPIAIIQERMRRAGLWWPGNLTAQGRMGWTHFNRVHWPDRDEIQYPINATTGKPVGPYFARHNREPWFESVVGSSTQFDTKRVSLSIDSVTLYFPFVVDSMSWRMTSKKYPNHWSSRVGSLEVPTMKDALTRPATFDAKKVREAKEFFMASVNSHCSGPSMHVLSVSVRELFGFAVYNSTNKPVHFLGGCPKQGRSRAGPRHPKFHEARFGKASTIELLNPHRFAIVFENSATSGYFTEKIVGAYLAQSIPVYFGPSSRQVAAVLNTKSFVHCDLPYNIVNLQSLGKLLSDSCLQYPNNKNDCIFKAYEPALNNLLYPHFEKCIQRIIELNDDPAKYEAMLKEPLVPLDANGNPKGVWDPTEMGLILRSLMVGLGFVDIPA